MLNTAKDNIVRGLELLATVPPLRSEAKKILAMEMLQPAMPQEVWGATASVEALSQAIWVLLRNADLMADAIDAVVNEDDPNAILLKLPPTDSAAEFRQTVDDFLKALEVPVARVFNGAQLRFGGFDCGTDWIALVGYTAAIPAFVLSIFKLGLGFLEEGRRREAALKAFEGISETLLAQMSLANKAAGELAQVHLRAAAEELVTRSNPDLDEGARREAVIVLVNSIKTLAELTQKGAEVCHAITAPKEVKDAAPKLEDIQKAIQSGQQFVGLLGPKPEDPPEP